MELTPALHDRILRQLPDAGPILFFGSVALADELRTPLTVVDDLTKPARLTRLAQGRPVLRAHLDGLPFAERSVAAIVAVEALSRYASPDAALTAWSRTLRDGGTLVLVERIVQSATLRTLHRLIEPSRHWLPPEHLTCLLLNAGYVRIGQLWPPTRLRSVITVGRLRVL